MSTLTEWTGRLIQTWLRWNARATQSVGEYCTVIYRPVTDGVPGFNFAESSGLECAPFPIIKGLTLIGRESPFRASYVRFNGGARNRASGYTRCSRTIEVRVPVSSHAQPGDGYLAHNALLVRSWLVRRGFHSSHVAAILGR